MEGKICRCSEVVVIEMGVVATCICKVVEVMETEVVVTCKRNEEVIM